MRTGAGESATAKQSGRWEGRGSEIGAESRRGGEETSEKTGRKGQAANATSHKTLSLLSKKGEREKKGERKKRERKNTNEKRCS